ncbi:MAG TPA: UDP-N-acetylglucosamine 2-epimerase, partial [Methanobacterium sp.]|nr:UDP-N-acetylglucosamine 2-epimerase [Methanobacterium sp.]
TAINLISEYIKVLFPIHPRTKKIIEDNNIEISSTVLMVDPIGYKEFIGLVANSKFIMSDSGGLQEEAGILNVPCLILRENTEWEYLVTLEKNILVGTDPEKIFKAAKNLLIDEKKLIEMKNIKSPVEKGSSKKIVDVLINIQ